MLTAGFGHEVSGPGRFVAAGVLLPGPSGGRFVLKRRMG
ncbi:hypothetical protein M877_25985 [Streptomyces niveus NCIMB 11891]|nr:hypothetical protein M877_25985 [Streptomyces niveus NCIMB 11891]